MRCLPRRRFGSHDLIDGRFVLGLGPVAGFAADRHRRCDGSVDAEPGRALVQNRGATSAGGGASASDNQGLPHHGGHVERAGGCQ